jgi:cathepsin L
MKAAILAILLGVVASVPVWQTELTVSDFFRMNTHESFLEWSEEYNREYGSIETEAEHYVTWLENVFVIARVNTRSLSYRLGLNQFTDMTGDEFRYYVHGQDGACFKQSELINIGGMDVSSSSDSSDVEAPASVDWTTKGVVTPVKNQAQCGSCWAFSATGAMECDYAIKTGTLNSLSEQQLVDCAGSKYGCAGCNGGQMYGAMEYAADNKGLCLESAYKYTAKNGQCKATSCGSKYDAPSGKGYTPVTKKSEPSMQTASVAGCVSIGIEADQTAFQHYSSGVLTGTCGTRIDHGVLIVGYGTSGTQDYWKVKNSWGVSWGNKGYIDICRNCNKNNGDGECGILMEGNVPNY